MIVGNFGGSGFLEYTAYGDAVNVTSRLEAVNKQFGTRICVGQATVDEIPTFQGRPVGELLLKGKSTALQVYEPLAADDLQSEAADAYRRAYDKMHAGDPTAMQAFAAYVGRYGEDHLGSFHLQRLLAGEFGVEIQVSV